MLTTLLALWGTSRHLWAGSGAARARARAHATASGSAPPLLLFTSDLCAAHDAGGGHPESPERLTSLLALARAEWAAEMGPRLALREPEADATDEQLLRVHTAGHVARLRGAFAAAAARGATLSLDADTRVCPASGPAALRAAGLVVAAVDAVCAPSAGATRAFVMARPPGHHAEPDRAMGFCLFNSVMVGVAHAQAAHGKRRVALLDWDVHHGNGGQAMCADHADRFFASSHQSPCYPGSGNKAGASGVAGQVLNAPLKPGAGSAEFRKAWAEVILPAMVAFAPDAVFVSAGFDGHEFDPLASLCLREADYAWVSAAIVRAAGPDVPVVSYLEGGYEIGALGRCARAHVRGLLLLDEGGEEGGGGGGGGLVGPPSKVTNNVMMSTHQGARTQ
jgi:acetoin utilization deacetylase AcuC-like enzyme